MDRFVDKCLLLAASLALVALAGEVTGVEVVTLVVAVCASATCELLQRRWPIVLALAGMLCVLEAIVPGAWVALPLSAYDLGTTRPGWHFCIVPFTWALLVLLGNARPEAIAVVAALSAVSVLLAQRTLSSSERAVRLHRLQDDLSDKILDLSQKNRELEDAQSYESRAAALAERTRIARTIHDSVGHLLTRLVLQIEALKVIHSEQPGVVDDLNTIGAGVNEALDSMRASVHALDDSAFDLGIELNRIAQQSGIAHATVSCNVDEQPPVDTRRAIAAVVREALTNAARHAHAAHAQVRITSYPGLWQVRVENDGKVLANFDGLDDLEAKGMGLRSMRERVESLGGVLRVSVNEGHAPSEGHDPSRGHAASDARFVVFASIPRSEHAAPNQKEQTCA